MDNSLENRYHEEFDMAAYFCDPHSPWQKPCVENNIGLLRRWFMKKGTNFAEVSEEQLQKYIDIINNKYRKSLGYKSSYEAALEHGIIRENLNQKVAFEGRIYQPITAALLIYPDVALRSRMYPLLN